MDLKWKEKRASKHLFFFVMIIMWKLMTFVALVKTVLKPA